MSGQVIPYNQNHHSPQPLALTHYAVNIADIKAQVNLIQHVMREVMAEGEHYGTIPGCGEKKSLLKPGAEKLMLTFRLANDVDVDMIDLFGGHKEYRVKVTLYAPTGQRLGTGIGSCSTMEGKYRFRVGPTELTNKPVPKAYWDIRKENPTRAQDMLGGKGFTTKKDETGNWMIARQGERVEHDNPADYYNTVLKMAKKRGLVDAVLTSTAASDIFTQDIEEDPELYGNNPSPGQTSTPVPVPVPKKETAPESPREAEVVTPEDPISNDSILNALAARRIPFQLNEETGEIHATPSYQDSAARDFVKSLGFKWESKAKSWIK